MLIIKKEFINNTQDTRIRQLIAELSEFVCLPLFDQSIGDLFNILCLENSKKKQANSDCLDGLIKSILSKIIDSKPELENRVKSPKSLFTQYKEMLMLQRPFHNKVQYYASKLNTTPQNLNSICRKEINKSSSEFLAEHLINEAKRLLMYSDLSITEICESVGFRDNSHFSKYFKKRVQVSPSDFRFSQK